MCLGLGAVTLLLSTVQFSDPETRPTASGDGADVSTEWARRGTTLSGLIAAPSSTSPSWAAAASSDSSSSSPTSLTSRSTSAVAMPALPFNAPLSSAEGGVVTSGPCNAGDLKRWRPAKCAEDDDWLVPWMTSGRWRDLDGLQVGADNDLARNTSTAAAANGKKLARQEDEAPHDFVMIDVWANKGYVIAGWLDTLLGAENPFSSRNLAVGLYVAKQMLPGYTSTGQWASLCGGCCECATTPPRIPHNRRPRLPLIVGFEPGPANARWLRKFFWNQSLVKIVNAAVSDLSSTMYFPDVELGKEIGKVVTEPLPGYVPVQVVSLRDYFGLLHLPGRHAQGAPPSPSASEMAVVAGGNHDDVHPASPNLDLGNRTTHIATIATPPPVNTTHMMVTNPRLAAALSSASSLQGWMSTPPPPFIHVLSTDAEGFDQSVARGARDYLLTGRVGVYQFEMYRAENYTAVFDVLSRSGYECFFGTNSRRAANGKVPSVPRLVRISGPCWREEFNSYIGWVNGLCYNVRVPTLKRIFAGLAARRFKGVTGLCDGRARQLRIAQVLNDRLVAPILQRWRDEHHQQGNNSGGVVSVAPTKLPPITVAAGDASTRRLADGPPMSPTHLGPDAMVAAEADRTSPSTMVDIAREAAATTPNIVASAGDVEAARVGSDDHGPSSFSPPSPSLMISLGPSGRAMTSTRRSSADAEAFWLKEVFGRHAPPVTPFAV